MKLRFLPQIAFIFFTSMYAVAQNQNVVLSDTATANVLMKQATTFYAQKKYDEAILKLDSAQIIFEKVLGKETKEAAEAIHQKGNSLLSLSKFEEAIACYQKSVAIRVKVLGSTHADVGKSYNNIGTCYRNLTEFEKSIDYFKKSLAINSKIKNGQTVSTAISYRNIGTTLFLQGAYDEAIESFKKSLLIRKKLFGEDDLSLTSDYTYMSGSFLGKNEEIKAIEVLQKAIKITTKYPDQELAATDFLNNIGTYYATLGYYKKALEFDLNALKIYSKYVGGENQFVSVTYSNISNDFFYLNEVDSAILYLHKTLEQIKNTSVLNQLTLPETYAMLGDVYYFKKNNFSKAIENYEEAIFQYLAIGGYALPNLAQLYTVTANAYVDINDFSKAESYFQKTWEILNYTEKNNFSNCKSLTKLIFLLNSYSRFSYKQYAVSQKKTYLNQAIELNNQAVLCLDFQNKLFNSDLQKIVHRQNAKKVYENKLLYLSHLDENDSLKQVALNNFEKSKGLVLSNQMNESKALRFAGIPDSLLKKELDLRLAISGLEKARQKIIDTSKTELEKNAIAYSIRIIDLKQQYEALKNIFEKNYPEFYRLKYVVPELSISNIQKNTLAEDQTLVEYFVGDSTLFIFTINKNVSKFYKINQNAKYIDSLVQGMREGIVGYHSNKIDSVNLASPARFTTCATELYKLLIAPIENDLKKKVIFIPDNILNYVPYEALISKKDEKPYRFNAHKYFIDNHEVSYCFSANLLNEMQTQSHQQTLNKYLIAMAPFTTNDTILSPETLIDIERKRDIIKPLPNSGQEVAAITKIMGGKAYYGKDATTNTFIELAPNVRIIHLATHSKANSDLGNNSYLAFSETKDSTQSTFLFANDLYNMHLNADMVVLSACETGIGEIKKGEGVIGLTRAFSFAGAKSIITSLWEVSDEKTKILMTDFYKYIKRGHTKDEALWRAKRDFMRKTLNDPYFWASFIAIGDMSALKK